MFCFHREYEMSFYMVFCLNETKKRRYCFDKSDRFSSVSKSRSATCYDFVYCSIQIENYSRGNKKRKHQGESFELYHLYLFVISLWMWMVVVVVVVVQTNGIMRWLVIVYRTATAKHPHCNFPFRKFVVFILVWSDTFVELTQPFVLPKKPLSTFRISSRNCVNSQQQHGAVSVQFLW